MFLFREAKSLIRSGFQDERKPMCGRCEKGGFSCEGFRELTFVDAKEQVMKRFAYRSKVGLSSNTSATSNVKASSRQLDAAMNNTMNSVVGCWHDSQPMQLSGHVPMSQYPSSSRDETYILYTVENLCTGPLATVYRSIFPCNPSILHPNRVLMSHCLLALAKVFYGLKNRERRVLRDGMSLYGQGLSMLSVVLDRDNSSITTEIIVSVLSLSISESIMPTSNFSWMSHILGLERLFAVQGPSMFEYSTVLDHAILELCRPLMILGAFFTQRPSLMGEPGWKVTMQPQAPDGNPNLIQISTATSDLSFLMGILAELPTIFLQCNECIRLARTNSSVPPPACLTTIGIRVSQLQQELQAWKEKWKHNQQSEVYETLPITMVESTRIPAWKTVFYFSSVEFAITFAMYHSVVILLTSIPISLLQLGLFGPSSSDADISDFHVGSSSQSLLSDMQISVRSICRSIEYHLRSLQPSRAPADFYLFFPIHVARRASLQLGYFLELAWLVDAFTAMKSSYPMGVWANMDFADRFSGLQEGLFG